MILNFWVLAFSSECLRFFTLWYHFEENRSKNQFWLYLALAFQEDTVVFVCIFHLMTFYERAHLYIKKTTQERFSLWKFMSSSINFYIDYVLSYCHFRYKVIQFIYNDVVGKFYRYLKCILKIFYNMSFNQRSIIKSDEGNKFSKFLITKKKFQ